MEPRLLLQWLLDRDGDNSNSLAGKLKNATTQPQIHKYLSGKAKQPRHSTLDPIAKHYGIPIEALYSEDVADSVMTKLAATPPTLTATVFESKQAVSLTNKSPVAISFDDAVRVIAQKLMEVDEATGRRAMGVLADLATDPQDFERLARATAAVIDTGKRRVA